MTTRSPVATTFTFRLGLGLKRSLGELARRNERSPGAELRIALRRHLEAETRRQGEGLAPSPGGSR